MRFSKVVSSSPYAIKKEGIVLENPLKWSRTESSMVEAIVESFSAMQEDLTKEKRYYQKKWAETEKRIEKVINNTVGMYGDLEGMVSLPHIQALELEYDSQKDEG